MATYKLRTEVNNRRFKNLRVEDLIKSDEGQKYLLHIHLSDVYNVKLHDEVLNALANNLSTIEQLKHDALLGVVLPDTKEITKVSHEKYPKTKPMNYLQEGYRMGFCIGAKWMQNKVR